MLTFNIAIGETQTYTLIDEGAEDDFISRFFIIKNKHPTKLSSSIIISRAEGNRKVSNEKVLTTIIIPDFEETITFLVANMGKCDIILGKPWLNKHNSHIN